MFFIAINLLTQLSQIGIEIGGFDSASGVSFHHKAYYLADGCISLAAAVSAIHLELVEYYLCSTSG